MIKYNSTDVQKEPEKCLGAKWQSFDQLPKVTYDGT